MRPPNLGLIPMGGSHMPQTGGFSSFDNQDNNLEVNMKPILIDVSPIDKNEEKQSIPNPIVESPVLEIGGPDVMHMQ